MVPCQSLDDLVTRFIDDECTAEEQAMAVEHLRECAACRERVEAESTARHVLHAHAAAARTMGVAPAWRPRVRRLGRPWLPAAPATLVLAATIAIGLFVAWRRPADASAIGVIGDSVCQHAHRFTTRFNVDERTCTLGCVERGAAFVLVTDGGVYQILNQALPEIPAFASRRVKVTGAVSGEAITISRIAAVDRE